jgi:hypothetical protein
VSFWRTNGWVGEIRVSGKRIYLGKFPSEQAAAVAYDRAAVRYFGDRARLNFMRRPVVGTAVMPTIDFPGEEGARRA